MRLAPWPVVVAPPGPVCELVPAVLVLGTVVLPAPRILHASCCACKAWPPPSSRTFASFG